MAPSLMERMSALATRFEVRGLLGRLGAPLAGDRVKATGDVREHMATDERVVPALLRVLADDAEELVRFSAADALAQLGDLTVDAASLRRATDGLVEAFRVDSAYSVRVRFAKTLQVLGCTSCSECAASFSCADVHYHGKYDLPEVEGACFVCGAWLRGPAAELAGRPCPSCGVTLPTVAGE